MSVTMSVFSTKKTVLIANTLPLICSTFAPTGLLDCGELDAAKHKSKSLDGSNSVHKNEQQVQQGSYYGLYSNNVYSNGSPALLNNQQGFNNPQNPLKMIYKLSEQIINVIKSEDLSKLSSLVTEFIRCMREMHPELVQAVEPVILALTERATSSKPALDPLLLATLFSPR